MEEKSYGAAVDMWSLGVIVYILVTGAMPRDLWKSALKYGRVAEADFGFDCYEWDTVSEAARDFVRRCLTHDPKRRLSAADALEHPWMKKVSNVRPAPLRIKSQLRDFAKGMKLPTRTYQKGDVLIKQGERATDEVFLIKSGKVNIVVADRATEERVLVATRETGEFVGEMSVGSAALTRAESAGSTGVEGSSKKKGSTAAKSGAPDSPSSMSSFQATLAAKIAGKKWVGKRRTADVVAATKVECLVLGRKEMEWAITHDETIKNELAKDIDSKEGADAGEAGEEQERQGRTSDEGNGAGGRRRRRVTRRSKRALERGPKRASLVYIGYAICVYYEGPRRVAPRDDASERRLRSSGSPASVTAWGAGGAVFVRSTGA